MTGAQEAGEVEATQTAPQDPIRTRSQIRDLARKRIGGRDLVIVSNREPFTHTRQPDGSVRVRATVGGLTLALNSAMQAVGGIWVAHGSGDADRESSDPEGRVRVPPDRPSYELQRVWLDEQEHDGYYNGFANQALWPLCHNAYAKPVFRDMHWRAYQHVNAKFAAAVSRVIRDREAVIFIQDYHFALLPSLLRERCPRAICLHFWHIPWPLPDILRICPWYRPVLEGILGNDVLGFHTPNYATRFLKAARGLPGWRRDGGSAISSSGRRVTVGAFPISIDFDRVSTRASSPECTVAMQRLTSKYGLAGKFVVLGLDRIDYTKGLLERLQAVETLLERHTEMRNTLAFVSAGAPSRTEIPAYRDLHVAVDETVDRINSRFGSAGRPPVVSIKEHLSEAEVLALYRLCDVCIVSSLEDGMNLVAKEFIAARNDEGGRLLLSRFTGAAWELAGAETFNPFATDELADRLFQISTAREGENRTLMRELRTQVRRHTIYGWIGGILDAIPTGRSRT